MSDLERDLRDDLTRRAAAVEPPPADWDDLTARMSRRQRRSRAWLSAGLVVALVAGPLAGFAIAQSLDEEPGARISAGAAGSDRAVATAESGLARTASSAVFGVASGPVTKLFRRSTDGIVIRAFTTPNSSPCQGDGWCPPPSCFPDAQVTGQLSTDDAVGVAWGSHYGGTAPALRVSGVSQFGDNGEGSPVRWVVAQAGAGVKTVRVSFAGGGTDEMAPVDGVVVLAARADPAQTGGTVEALDGAGAVVGRADADATETMLGVGFVPAGAIRLEGGGSGGDTSVTTTVAPPAGATDPASEPSTTVVQPGVVASPDGALPAECSPPPPTLPAPGEQPADPGAARAAVTDAFTTAYAGGVGSDDAKRAAVQDGDALAETMDAARSGGFAQQVKDAHAVVTEVVFTSPTEAAVRYDIKIENYTNFDGRIGKAVLVDGRWKVARVTVCADLSLAGVTCPKP
jgi:hypothetical protein